MNWTGCFSDTQWPTWLPSYWKIPLWATVLGNMQLVFPWGHKLIYIHRGVVNMPTTPYTMEILVVSGFWCYSFFVSSTNDIHSIARESWLCKAWVIFCPAGPTKVRTNKEGGHSTYTVTHISHVWLDEAYTWIESHIWLDKAYTDIKRARAFFFKL